MATVSTNGDFRLWTQGLNIYTQDAHDLGIQSCDFSQNPEPIPNFDLNKDSNYLLATCGNDSTVKLWAIAANEVQKRTD